jgi:hypothetical protein
MDVTWYLLSREERRLRMSENRVLRRIFGPKWGEGRSWWEAGEGCIMRSFMICTVHQILPG